jgi:uroporphyrinogen decarboxylase
MNYAGSFKPEPRFDRLLAVLRREGEPDRIPFLELFADPEIIETVLGKPVPRMAAPEPVPLGKEALACYCDRLIEFSLVLGYDYVVSLVASGASYDYGFLGAQDTAAISRGQRSWAREAQGLITSWEDFEKYPWPTNEPESYWMIEYLTNHMPEGMKLMPHGGTILEPVTWLMGYETLALALYDQPDLLETMFDRIGQLALENCETLCQFDGVGAVWISDDIGHRSGPMIAPEHLRHYVFPWWKRLAKCIHSHGLPVPLHSCGDLTVVMDDIIDDVGIDAKHSYEDTFLPVGEAKRRYGDRIALLGGIDMDFLCRASEEQVREYVRRVIDVCGPGGGYALGTGNTVANYVPVRNYLAMLDEGRRYGTYPLTG